MNHLAHAWLSPTRDPEALAGNVLAATFEKLLGDLHRNFSRETVR